MKKLQLIATAMIAACSILTAIALAASDATDTGAPAAGEMQLPEGWTMEDMQAMMAAGTPGEMHQRLAEDVGTWRTKCTMWMTPDSKPLESEGVSTVTPLMDGRFIQVQMKGEMPGMGEYSGQGIYGYDNVSEKFVAIWIDNHTTGIMSGTGELSDDGKTITWNYTGNCPVAGKPISIRDVETATGPNTKTIESFGPDRKTGKEYQMMRIEMTKE